MKKHGRRLMLQLWGIKPWDIWRILSKEWLKFTSSKQLLLMRMIYKGTQVRQIHVSLQMSLSIFVSILYPFVGNGPFTLLSADVNSSTEKIVLNYYRRRFRNHYRSARTKPYGTMLQVVLFWCDPKRAVSLASVTHLEAKRKLPTCSVP